MMLKRIVSGMFMLILLIPHSIGVDAKTRDMALHALKDPGNVPPPLHAEDYDSYRSPGTSVIGGTIKFDEPRFAGFLSDFPFLYPDTPYTQWLIRKWIVDVDGKSLLKNNLVYPGDRGMNIQVPDYLNYFGPGRDKAIIAGIRENHRDFAYVYFEHVPAGNYIFIDLIQRGIAYTSYDYDNVTLNGPYGVGLGYIKTSHDGTHPADGYILMSPYHLVVEANHQYTIKSEGFVPLAYFLDG